MASGEIFVMTCASVSRVVPAASGTTTSAPHSHLGRVRPQLGWAVGTTPPWWGREEDSPKISTGSSQSGCGLGWGARAESI